MKEKRVSRQVPMTEHEWAHKVETIRRKYNLTSRAKAIRHIVDKEFDRIEMGKK
jgi:hypothetical protein